MKDFLLSISESKVKKEKFFMEKTMVLRTLDIVGDEFLSTTEEMRLASVSFNKSLFDGTDYTQKLRELNQVKQKYLDLEVELLTRSCEIFETTTQFEVFEFLVFKKEEAIFSAETFRLRELYRTTWEDELGTGVNTWRGISDKYTEYLRSRSDGGEIEMQTTLRLNAITRY